MLFCRPSERQTGNKKLTASVVPACITGEQREGGGGRWRGGGIIRAVLVQICLNIVTCLLSGL